MHKCNYCTFCCMDFRFQKAMEDLLRSIGVEYGDFDRISIPGGAGDTEATLKYIALSSKLHDSQVYILTGHEDCGAGKTLDDLKTTMKSAKNTYPQKDIRGYFIKLDGSWEKVENSDL